MVRQGAFLGQFSCYVRTAEHEEQPATAVCQTILTNRPVQVSWTAHVLTNQASDNHQKPFWTLASILYLIWHTHTNSEEKHVNSISKMNIIPAFFYFSEDCDTVFCMCTVPKLAWYLSWYETWTVLSHGIPIKSTL